MLLTKSQLYTFWRQWNTLVTARAWPKAEAEAERHALLQRAGFTSLTQVDKLAGFDRVLAELQALAHPANLDAQLRQQNQPLIRLRYRIRHHKLPEPYWRPIALARFGTADLDQLTVEQLTQLRNTLDDRLVKERRAGTSAVRTQRTRSRRQLAAADPDARIKFPDLAIGDPAIVDAAPPALHSLSEGGSDSSDPSDSCPRCGCFLNLDGYCEECEERASQRRLLDTINARADISADCPF